MPTRQFYKLRDSSLLKCLRSQLGHFKFVEILIQSFVSSFLPAQASASSTSSSGIGFGGHSLDRTKLVHVLIFSSRLCGEILPNDRQMDDSIAVSSEASHGDSDYSVDNRLIDQMLHVADICFHLADKVEFLIIILLCE